ncbi:hypothetical protein A2870_03605 [Candidatus Curtissbacteria bacterium RIFCSPHIGHO2_01_FULL_41_11]|uniref:Uncharacterized protein n=1 Tax=Candidatus Curtissbacteria bacterium RIFCSPHIGHO2_01_FULL_41_11 TaxID=1797711 RepID=A0A1F5G5T4_9BACT|nr:MAG: hypothetical protein A2870_03605 [Candidatus Curtissbacteria bacterium RIFCSPHIGHO2_01_FULL_41_11]
MQEQNQTKPITEHTAQKLVGILSKSTLDKTAVKSFDLAKKPVLQIRNNQIIAGITGTVGLVIFALGVENFITNILGLSSPYIEVLIGLVLLSVSGLLLKKIF